MLLCPLSALIKRLELVHRRPEAGFRQRDRSENIFAISRSFVDGAFAFAVINTESPNCDGFARRFDYFEWRCWKLSFILGRFRLRVAFCDERGAHELDRPNVFDENWKKEQRAARTVFIQYNPPTTNINFKKIKVRDSVLVPPFV